MINERIGRFTASQAGLLLKRGRSKSDVFGQQAMGLIRQKAAEIITGQTIMEIQDVSSRATDWGKTNEPLAVEAYGQPVQFTGENQMFFAYGEIGGATPDGVVGEDGLLEVKCPWNPGEHIMNMLLEDQSEFAEYHDDYYPQIQMQLLCSGRQWVDFVSFDPRCVEPAHRIHVIRIVRDEAMISDLRERLTLAALERDRIVQRINDRIL